MFVVSLNFSLKQLFASTKCRYREPDTAASKQKKKKKKKIKDAISDQFQIKL